MSHRYSLTFNLMTEDREVATAAVADAARLIDEKCIVDDSATAVRRLRGITTAAVRFTAANDAEAADLAHRVSTLPGLPPMDAIKWRRLSEVSAR